MRVANSKYWNYQEIDIFYKGAPSNQKKRFLTRNINYFSFFDSVDRIANPNYMPTEMDILLTRTKTTGIVEVAFIIKKVQFR